MRSRALFVVLTVVGCRRDPPPPPTLDIAEPAGVASALEKVTCRVGPKQTTLALDQDGLHLRFVTARGNTVSMLGQSVIVGDADSALKDAIARFADARVGGEWLDVEAKVESPDGQGATVKVSLRIDHAMAKRLEAVRAGAVIFPDESPGASPRKLAYVRPADDAPAYTIGEGRWRDVDLVAFESSKHSGGKLCGTKQGSWGDIAVMSGHTTSHVELFDRRAGKRVGETTIEGADVCPDERDAASASNVAAIRAWVASKLAP